MLLGWGIMGLTRSATPPPDVNRPPDPQAASAKIDPLAAAFKAATQAAQLSQTAVTPEEWSTVAATWAAAIQSLQAVPPEDPQWLFAQRKAREYLANQTIAQQRAEAAGAPVIFPSLGNPILDEQLGLYLSYLATFGPPDIMVVGSSRALQGLNPQILQQRLATQGYESLRVYTFAVNGATAQVMSFVLRWLLTPEQMPRMIIWAGGSRSFNSGRVDRTFARILESPGYAALQAGDRPVMNWNHTPEPVSSRPKADPMPVTGLDGYGFLAVNDVFDPETYYQQFPRVLGLYDGAYQPFLLDGLQTVSLRAIATFTRSQEIPLVFVNLPLSADYLDDTRLFYEQQFQQYIASEAALGGFTVVDLLQEWPTQNHFFADPSHLNRIGAAQVAIRLAQDPTIPWQVLQPQGEGAIGPATEADNPDRATPNPDTEPATGIPN
jgi:hypothetical protein